MSHYLTTGQAAQLLGVSKPTVVRAVERGMLRPALVTPGHHRRFRRDDIVRFGREVLQQGPVVHSGGRELAGAPTPRLRRMATAGGR